MTDRLRPAARLLTGWADPSWLFATGEALEPHAFWLDAGSDAAEGWSYLGSGTPDAAGPGHVVIDGSLARPTDAGEPPFRGGWVGWVDYESGAARAGAPVEAGEPPAWLRTDRLLAFDHARRAVWAVAQAEEIDAFAAAAQDRLDGIRSSSERSTERAQRVDVTGRDAFREEGSAGRPEGAEAAVSARHTPEAYAALIEECRELIRRGEAYQLCLTTRFSVVGDVDPVATYLRLRAATPAHHGGFIRVGDRALLSASPEQFLHAEAGRIRTRPIKGTRPRGSDAASDAALAAELVESVKERAENVMIVDLMRNDLSRICEPGSIRVDALFAVESYPAVHQLVSTVSGRSVPGATVARLWEVAFPAGSMTGAPKLSAMTHLHALEGGRRGVYSGCFGYVGDDGALDLAMVIRSIVTAPGGAYVGAGGGITWRSDAAAEVAEVATKARAPLSALGARLPAEWADAR